MDVSYIKEKLEDISKALSNIQELDKEQALLKKEVEALSGIVNKLPNTIETISTNSQEIDKVFRERFVRLMQNYLRSKEAQKDLEELIVEKINRNNEFRDAERAKRDRALLIKIMAGGATVFVTGLTFLVEFGIISIKVSG